MKRNLFIALAMTPLVGGCDNPMATTEPGLQPDGAVASMAPASTHGGGHFIISGLDVQFAFTAVRINERGTAVGNARHSVELGGELVEFHTSVTCMTVDRENGRAWIGGVITRNASTHPSFTGAVNEVGDDIWFRVVDYGEGAAAEQLDRATFVGFEGGAGIITSEEYCTTQPWPAGDDRTNPVTEGNIQVGD